MLKIRGHSMRKLNGAKAKVKIKTPYFVCLEIAAH